MQTRPIRSRRRIVRTCRKSWKPGKKLEARYPEARFTFIDGAIGGTGSDLGVFRLQRDCLAYKPDLVFLDFSANDNVHKPQPERLAAYESLVRRLVTEGRCPVVIAVFPFKWDVALGTADNMPGRIAHRKTFLETTFLGTDPKNLLGTDPKNPGDRPQKPTNLQGCEKLRDFLSAH
ncbi:MAG: SGNH/GDSL hydrolase family protein [Kiritimatiellia bacterium]